ncbi:tyrosine-type recombinase/integrase [Nocardia sp. NPDC058640]|uniref:tyrosine-type recombinase/integrase n=1 Tax=Nocardia sp. NPDC058640 TaxID=3346571 RepID=UPI00364930E4
MPKEKTARSKSAAKSALKSYIDKLNKSAGPGSSLITPDTKIPVLADLWLAECERDEGIDAESIEQYRGQINPTERRLKKDGTPDRRVDPDSVRIKTAFAGLSVRELTAPRVAAHEALILARGTKSKLKLHRIILKGMMNLAVQHGAILPGAHPVMALKPLRGSSPSVRALTMVELVELRAQLRAYSLGEAIEGGAKAGRRRAPHLVRVLDMLLATGARPGEILGLRRCDVHRPEVVGDPWVLDIFGTVKRRPKGEGGTFRQAHTKTGPEGNRSVVLPKFAVSIVLEMGAAFWEPDDESPMFPTRTGGWRLPSDIRTPWNEARGSRFGWVQQRTLRKTVATIIDAEYGADQAGRQLGHRKGSKITEMHYIDRPVLAPDSTPALERFNGGGDE